MSERIIYEEVDFVDYFARTTGVSDEHILRVASVPKCLAAIDAFAKTPMRLGKALSLVGDELDRLDLPQAGGGSGGVAGKKIYPFAYVLLIKQIARRIELDVEDARSFKISAEIKNHFGELYVFSPSSKLAFQNWLNKEASFEAYEEDIEDIWQSIRRHDEREYLSYWQIAHRDLLQSLFSNRRFVAGLEASYAARVTDPSYIYGMVDEVVVDQMPLLPTKFRFMLYRQLASRMSLNLLRVPKSLREDFPEFYRDQEET